MINCSVLFGQLNIDLNDRELQIWERLSINPKSYSGKWYLETGSSMGATINIAIGLGGYTLTDRATWIKFSNKKKKFFLVCKGFWGIRDQKKKENF